MDAQGALESSLGRLTSILVEEAQLLGRVRGDVEFIKEEMECMNSLILQLTEAQYRDHLVRAWMKQVVGLTRDCEGNVEHYIHYVGSRPGDDSLLGPLRRVLRFLRTIAVRHRIATQIRQLKIRAREVGDRRQRYGVTVPASTSRADMNYVDNEPTKEQEQEDLRRRAVLLRGAEPPADEGVVVTRAKQTLIKCLSSSKVPAKYGSSISGPLFVVPVQIKDDEIEDGEIEDGAPLPQVMVFSILGYELADDVAKSAYCYEQYPSLANLFNCKAWSVGGDVVTVLTEILEQVRGQRQTTVTENQAAGTTEEVHAQILEQVGRDQLQSDQAEITTEDHRENQLLSKIKGHLRGKRFMIVVTTHELSKFEWKHILDALLGVVDGSLPGSAIIMTTQNYELATSSSPCKIIDARSLIEFYTNKAYELTADKSRDIIWRLGNNKGSPFARRILMHLLYANPTKTLIVDKAVYECIEMNRSVAQTMVMLCYNELPSKYWRCLLYLTIFPQGHVIKTTRLARKWIAEGLVTTTSDQTESEGEAAKAGHYWDVLFIRGFISPVEISAQGNIKSFTLKDEVHKVIAKIAREVNIVDTNLPTDLARHLSIHNRIVLPKSHSIADSTDIVASLQSLARSSQWQQLKVLDLEGCHGLEKHHLRSICKILLLKYLSLRNTDVTELPKQIKELQCLETLDIRQTKVRVLAKKTTVLPLLKHFLGGHKIPAANDSIASEDSFSAMQMPLCIEKMINMEILSHVRVSNSKELASIAQLLKLRKLGVALHGKQAKLSDLFCQIEKLHRCLRSLSVRVDREGGSDVAMTDPLHSIPQFIERLNISGITGGLRHLIQEHHKLTKITLCEAQLKEADLTILGKLGNLHCLRLQHNSYAESEIIFKREEFQSLNYLLVDVNDITKLRFASGAALNLERIVWSFARMDALSGLINLRKLKNLELNGDCDLHPIEEELFWHLNDPKVKHNPQHQGHEDGTAAPTSSSSAP